MYNDLNDSTMIQNIAIVLFTYHVPMLFFCPSWHNFEDPEQNFIFFFNFYITN